MATTKTGAARRCITAFFDDREAAQKAVDDLAAAGIGRNRITLVAGDDGPAATQPVPSAEKGLWAAVKDLFMADEDRHAYGEGLRRGGFLLSVMAAGDDARIVEILDCEGAVDMDARQSDWELQGWDPARASAGLDALADLRSPPTSAPDVSSDDVRAAVEPAAAVGPAFGAGKGKDVPPRAEPRVVRDPDAEGLRLRTYVESHDHPDLPR